MREANCSRPAGLFLELVSSDFCVVVVLFRLVVFCELVLLLSALPLRVLALPWVLFVAQVFLDCCFEIMNSRFLFFLLSVFARVYFVHVYFTCVFSLGFSTKRVVFYRVMV